MLKFKLLFAAVPITLFLWVMAAAVTAQEEIPSPYAGQENPFSWDDESAISAGQELYKNSCLGCHGADGSNLSDYDFSAAGFTKLLEQKVDFYFWVVSEGRLEKGMPPYKSSLSEEQRWQVLTYLHTLAEEATPEVTPEPAETAEPSETSSPAAEPKPSTSLANAEKSDSLLMVLPEQAPSGRPLTITAYLRDGHENPVANETVQFFIKVEFFTSGLMEIGESRTNDQGVAVFQYTPEQTGDLEMVSRSEDVETSVPLTIVDGDEPFYQAEAGIHLPAPGRELFIGPESARTLGEGGKAPTSAFRLPGGIISWLLLIVLTVMLIWFTYFRVIYQLFRIPIVSEIRDTDTRLLPRAGMVFVVVVGIVLVLMLLTGPYSHFQLFH
jgi:mono/diheme cytochrome c family protein